MLKQIWLLILLLVVISLSPCAADMLDLTALGSSGSINDALFIQADPHATGSGLIHSIVRMQATGTEEGYNTDYRPVEFDENTSPTFTRSVPWNTIPLVVIDEVPYREFLLDVNETTPKSLLSLDKLEIYLLPNADKHEYASFGTPIYTMDPVGQDNWIKLDYTLNSGSGGGDMFAYIPDSLFKGPNQFLYLYSRFGDNISADDGFEEWAWVENNVIPEPSSLLALLAGVAGLAGFITRKRS